MDSENYGFKRSTTGIKEFKLKVSQDGSPRKRSMLMQGLNQNPKFLKLIPSFDMDESGPSDSNKTPLSIDVNPYLNASHGIPLHTETSDDSDDSAR